MEARLACWESALPLHPGDPDLGSKVADLMLGARFFVPSPVVVRFVCALTARLPEYGLGPDTVWARRPLTASIAGRIIQLPIKIAHVSTVKPLVEELARQHGLQFADLGRFSEVAARSLVA